MCPVVLMTRVSLLVMLTAVLSVGSFGNANEQYFLERGDVLLSVNGHALDSEDDYIRAVQGSPRMMRFTIINKRNGRLCALQTRLRPPGQGLKFGVTAAERRGEGLLIRNVQRSSPATKCELDQELDLATEVARFLAFESENPEQNGSLLVHEWDKSDAAGDAFQIIAPPQVPMRVWRVANGKLQLAKYEALQAAFGSDRSKWPPSTICFAITLQDSGRVEARVAHHYDCGIAADSRGGNSCELTLAKRNNSWKLVRFQPGAHWD